MSLALPLAALWLAAAIAAALAGGTGARRAVPRLVPAMVGFGVPILGLVTWRGGPLWGVGMLLLGVVVLTRLGRPAALVPQGGSFADASLSPSAVPSMPDAAATPPAETPLRPAAQPLETGGTGPR